ncbi:hypothetical protein [Pontibacter sp. G13]|uniref:hypothetical protein n=1 Tax=Pontibacter sp. G13 TaxID=3074898 RepID=UPI0028891308|nr:hypothetical protein [Pontibacter sp. G13]WNJ18981.1 hypothetical protein RJD25_00700 [Pontibacter sp. G13]
MMKACFQIILSSMVAFLVSIQLVYAQPEMDLSVHRTTIPNALQQLNYGQGWGMGLNFRSDNLLRQNLPVALRWGLNFGLVSGSAAKDEVELLAPAGGEGEIQVRNNAYLTMASLRLSTPANWRVIAYGEIAGGFNFVETREQVVLLHSYPGFEDGESVKVAGTNGLGYSFSTGVNIKLSQEVMLDLKSTWVFGRNSEFVDLETVYSNELNNGYQTVSAPFAQTQISAGFTFRIEDTCTPSRVHCITVDPLTEEE